MSGKMVISVYFIFCLDCCKISDRNKYLFLNYDWYEWSVEELFGLFLVSLIDVYQRQG